MIIDDDHISKFLRRHREYRGVSRARLARSCAGSVPGITAASIGFWETGYQNRRPNLAQYEVLCEALGLTPAEKLYGLQLAKHSLPGSTVPEAA